MQISGRCEKILRKSLSLSGVLFFGGCALAQTASSTVPDAQIEASVLKALAGAPQLATENIITNTVYGTVTLSGSVKDEPTRQMAETLASKADGVKKVVDELTIGSPDGGPNALSANAAPADPSQGSNPMLQSDGTMAPQQAQGQQAHAPDPDTYAAQHGMSAPTGQSNPPDDSANSSNNGQPAYRQPYGAPNGVTPAQPGPGYPGPNNAGGHQQPYPQGGYQGQQRNPPPPPYGAQVAGQPVTVPEGSLLRIRINEGLDSKDTQPGAPFDAVVLSDVVADGAVAIPRGASVQGTVVEAKSGGVLRGHGEIALQLHQVTLGGKSFPITSDVWSRDSDGKGGQTIGNAVGLGAVGAVIGAIAGGGGGAAIGAGVGGAAGVATSAASGGRQVLIPSEAILTFHLMQPALMTTISQAEMDRLSYGVPVGGQQPQMRRRYPPPPPYYGPVYYPRPYPYPY